MDIFICVVGILLCLVAIIGSILPGLPGPQLSYLAIILAQIFMNNPFSWWFVVIWGIVIIALMVLDYYLPIFGTKKFGGSNRGNRGCIIGMIVGMFIGPVGLILGPFVGALVGEYLHKNDMEKSVKPAFGAFIGFLSGVGLKLIVSIILLIYFCIGCYNHFFLTLDFFPSVENELTSLL